jgi:hypothetical protein
MEVAMSLRKLVLVVLLVSATAGTVTAQQASGETPLLPAGRMLGLDGWHEGRAGEGSSARLTLRVPDPVVADDFLGAWPEQSPRTLSAALVAASQAALAARPRAFEYSDAYATRARIHKYASFATIPLFAAQFAVGQKLYDGRGSDGLRSAHSALALGTAGLFGVNTITGSWNLYEGRKDPNHRKRRMAHGILMLVADAGFAATGALAPDDEGEGGVSRSTHRTIALTSMGIATASYLIMLIGN